MSPRIVYPWLLLVVTAALLGGKTRQVASAIESPPPQERHSLNPVLPASASSTDHRRLVRERLDVTPVPRRSGAEAQPEPSAADAEFYAAWLDALPTSVSASLALLLLWMAIRQRQARGELASLRAALNSTAEGLLVVDTDGHVVSYNRKFAEMWGLPRVMLEAQRDDILVQFVLPQLKDPDEFAATIKQLYEAPQSTCESSIEFCDGRIYIRRSEPHKVEGKIVGRVWGFRDVTSDRSRENALEQKSYAFRTFIDSLPDNIYFKDRESRFTRVNQALALAHGYRDYHDMVGKTDFDSCSEEHAKEAFADEQDLVNEIVHVISKEERETWPDGRETWVLTTKMPMRDPNGQIVGTFGISRDITIAKRMEQELSERERWLSAVLTGIRDSVVALDSLGVIQWMNPSAAALTGCDEVDCRGKLFEEVVRLAESEREPHEDECVRMNSLLSGKVSSLERMKATVRKADTTAVEVEVTGSLIEVDGNVIAGAVLVLREIVPIGAEVRDQR